MAPYRLTTLICLWSLSLQSVYDTALCSAKFLSSWELEIIPLLLTGPGGDGGLVTAAIIYAIMSLVPSSLMSRQITGSAGWRETQ